MNSTTWSDGYITEVEYVHGECLYLNPTLLKFAFLTSRVTCPEIRVACELGFGQGTGINIHAAASKVEWWGTDFNPTQAAFAQELASQVGSGVRLFDHSFEEFCVRPDLPVFDMIGLHGVWSWISDANKAVIVDFVQRRLRPGGVLYIGYNALPGWQTFAPVQHLIKRHNDVLSAPGQDILRRIEDAIAFAEGVLEADPLFLRTAPKAGERLKNFKELNARYLAHEYLNDNWTPMYVADLARWLKPTRCTFACSASLVDQVEELHLKPNQRALLDSIPEPIFRETVRDFLVNQWFRRDYWVKGLRRISKFEQYEKLLPQRLVLVTHPSQVPSEIWGARYKAPRDVYGPVLDLLADHRPQSLGDIGRALRGRDADFSDILRAVSILVGTGYLRPVQEESLVEQVKLTTDRLNVLLLERARTNNETPFLASPLTGSAITVSRIDQLFLLARRNGHSDPEDMGDFAWSVAQQQSARVRNKEGQVIEAPEDNRAELRLLARAFVDNTEPILRALGISPSYSRT